MHAATTLAYDEFQPRIEEAAPESIRPKYIITNAQGMNVTTAQYSEPSVPQDFVPHYAKLEALATDSALWPDDVDPPSLSALMFARVILQQLQLITLPPTRVVASAEGGIAFCFIEGDKYADIECLNEGAILGVLSNRRDRPTAWEIEPDPSGIARASEKIREFLHGRPARENASARAADR